MPIRRKPPASQDDQPTPVGEDRKTSPRPSPPAAQTHHSEPNQVKHLEAELQATKERVLLEAQREKRLLQAQLVENLLPVLDNLDRSLDASSNSPDPSLRDGVRMIRDQFEQVLRGYGVEAIDAMQVPFDPAEHEAVLLVPVEKEEEHRKVVAVLRPGYRHEGKLLRAAQVSVGDYRKPTISDSHEETESN